MKRNKKNEFFDGIKKGMEEAIAWSDGKALRMTIRNLSIRPKRESVRRHAKA